MAAPIPPPAPGVHDAMRRRMLRVLLLATLAYVPFITAVQLLADGFHPERLISSAIGMLGCVAAWRCVARGRTAIGIGVFIPVLVVMAGIGIARFGGAAAPGFGAGLAVVVAVVFLRGVRMASVVAALLIAEAALVTWGQSDGWLPAPLPVHGLSRLCVLSATYVWILVFAASPLAMLTRALAEADAERLAAERALAVRREAEDRYRVLCDTSTAGIWHIDTDGRTVHLNRAMCRLLAIDGPERVIGQPFQRFFTPASLEVMRLEHDKRRSGTASTYQVQLVDDRGARVDVLISGAPLSDEAGAVVGLIGTFTDIGQRIRAEQDLAASEERYRALIEHAPDAIVIIDPAHGLFIEANPQAERLYGLPRATLLARGPGDVSPALQEDGQASRSKAAALIARAIAGEALLFEWLHRDAAGRDFPCEVRLVRLPAARGRVLIRGSVSDISSRKEAERQVQAFNATLERQVAERTAQLESANRELESFSYSVSHDLRAPLRSIDGFSRVLLDEQSERLDEEGKGHLNRVIAAARRMSELIDGLLALARVSRGILATTHADLSAIARQAAEEVLRAHPERDIGLRVEDGLTATCDARLIRAVFDNLLGNAVKFTARRERAHIEIGGAVRDGMVHIHVRDDGAGFDPAYAHQLFKAFQRLHAVDEFPGTGIGLATVNRIIRRHGGAINAEGTPGVGACFRFSLPM